ncbi:hypothetical protein [Roseococcus sp. YIM B11640]|uniref:hypothetical protein n=1 Tax=Roseococcus sp. YIM B11640 TaxID=3133973 RepID=UPI003C7A4E2E
MRRHALACVLLLTAGCVKNNDLVQYDRMRNSNDPQAVAAESISCSEKDMACVRLLVLRGSACARLSEAPDVATRVRMRGCALDDFTAAQRQLPADAEAEDRRKVLTGLAEAQRNNRDNSGSRATADGLNQQLMTTATALGSIPGGASTAAYFKSEALAYQGQRAGSAGCADLRAARVGLPTAVGEDLAPRVETLRVSVTNAMQTQRCV